MCVRMKANNQLEIPLLRIGTSFLPHVIAGCLREMQTTHSDLADLTILQIDSGTKLQTVMIYELDFWTSPVAILTKQDEMVSWSDPIDSAPLGWSDWAPPI